MPKICNTKDCSNPVFGGGFCKWHQGYRKDKKQSIAKPKKAISPISKKRAKELTIYKKERDQYMKNHPNCEVIECNKKSQDLHHKKGRIGSLLWNRNYFMAVCRKCHNKIERNPQWAYDNKYAIRRI